MSLHPGIYRDRDGNLVEVLAVNDGGVTLRYTDGTIVVVSA
jgi:hypothetical protein